VRAEPAQILAAIDAFLASDDHLSVRDRVRRIRELRVVVIVG